VCCRHLGSDKLLVAGGCTDITGKCVSNVVECFDIPSSTWTELPPMNHARSECAASCCRGEFLDAAVVKGHEIYLVGAHELTYLFLVLTQECKPIVQHAIDLFT
jgi:hypothetical protein